MRALLAKVRQKVHLAVTLSLVLLFLLFLLQNTEQVQVALLFWTVSISRALILLVTLLLGIIIGIIATFGMQRGVSKPSASTFEGKKSELEK